MPEIILKLFCKLGWHKIDYLYGFERRGNAFRVICSRCRSQGRLGFARINKSAKKFTLNAKT